MSPEPSDAIALEGVRVHNLKSIDVRIPLHRFTVVTGVSGSGKSSLAFDTLYAEGQRRYLESFSPYARQFLERLDKPDADRIDNLPPAVALRQGTVSGGKRSTVATATELAVYLRLLFAKAGRIVDPATGREIRRDTPRSAVASLESLPPGRRLLVTFPAAALPAAAEPDRPSLGDRLADDALERGYARAVAAGRLVSLKKREEAEGGPSLDRTDFIVLDRLTTGRADPGRLEESLEVAFAAGDGRCVAFVEGEAAGEAFDIDGGRWTRLEFDRRLVSPATGRVFPELTPALFSFRSPLGACPTCQGFGRVPAFSWEKVVPDPSKTIREGAIVPWTTPAYTHERQELLDLADDYAIPVDVPFSTLEPQQLALIYDGVRARKFGGLKGFFRWLERKRYKIGVAALLARYRAYETCPDCDGSRLNPDALAVQVAGRNLGAIDRDTVAESRTFFASLDAQTLAADPAVARAILPEIRGRLETLDRLGLGYLRLDRPTGTLSSGEARRVALTAAVRSDLVNMLFVLDEPSAGLHPADRGRVIETLSALRDGPNTVVAVEHDPAFLAAADYVVDLGPGAGRNGGEVVYAGPVAGLAACERSVTAQWPASRGRQPADPALDSRPSTLDPKNPRADALGSPCLALERCTRHNLKNLAVAFPLNRLCVVTGLSGSGKSTLVGETLYPAVCRALKQSCEAEEADRGAVLTGAEAIDSVIWIDAAPIGRSSRSVPATYLGVFDAIRAAFAETPEAKLRNLTAGAFSFNAPRGGRCPHCEGAGAVTVDMQFLPDIETTCPECGGSRFRRDVLDVKLRGRTIADVLAMNAAEGFVFFRGLPQVQRRLSALKDVGLDYLPLGQPATTLSGGESQRLKIAWFLTQGGGKRTLFLLDEPTIGLHRADVAVLLDCLRRLVAVGHSVVAVEHHLDVVRAADWVIDLGPGAGDAGGQIVAAGPPEVIAQEPRSATGRALLAEP